MLNKYSEKVEDNLNMRIDGRVEWICKHGVGHTIYAPTGEEWEFIHGCCRCCEGKREEYKKLMRK